jgi:phosphoribosylformylglycinamidine synthase
MVACAIDEAIRNNIATGGTLDRMALLDNFCWSDPVFSEKNQDGPYKLAQLVRANMALYDYTTLFGTPCISGKDSMKNDYMFKDIKISVPRTVLISAISVIKDVKSVVTMDFKAAGNLIIVIGKTYAELGGSEYFTASGIHGNIPPKVRGQTAKKTFKCLEKAIRTGIIKSCHDISDGGIGCSLAESSFAGGFGVDVNLSYIPAIGIFRDDFLLFSESPSRFIVTIQEENLKRFRGIFSTIPFGIIGKTRKDQGFTLRGIHGNTIIDTRIDLLNKAWQSPFKEIFSA